MESILKKVNELEKALEKELTAQGIVTTEANELVAKNKEDRKKLAEKAKDLTAREKAIKPIEDIVAYKEEAEALNKEAKKKMKEVGIAQDELAEAKRSFSVYVAENRDRIAQEDARILDENAGIQKGYEQLKKAA